MLLATVLKLDICLSNLVYFVGNGDTAFAVQLASDFISQGNNGDGECFLSGEHFSFNIEEKRAFKINMQWWKWSDDRNYDVLMVRLLL